jgi:hypothetical protein
VHIRQLSFREANRMHTYKTAKFFFKNWSIHSTSVHLVGQELKVECYFRHKLPLYNVTKKCTYKIVLPHLANQNHNVNTCELLWFWFFIVAIKRNNESPVLESFRQRYVRPHQQFLENRVLVTQIFFLKEVDQMCFIRENSSLIGYNPNLLVV